MASDVVWQGKIGSIPLKVEVPHAGRIIAQWDSPQGRREKFCSSVEEFERSVLFQLLLSSGQTGAGEGQEAVEAVKKAEAERPAPPRREGTTRSKKKGSPRRHRRSRMQPRRR